MSTHQTSAEQLLAWAAGRFSPRLAFATGFGREGCVLVHLIATAGLPVDVFTLDTGLLFPETYALWRRLEERYGIAIRRVVPEETVREQAASHGERLWENEPDRCCALRKVEPLRRELARHDAWITAIRRDQTPDRALARNVERDARFSLVKINPLLDWSAAEVDAFVRSHDVPVNALHGLGYPSVGCFPCTTATLPGEDPRAGRWRGSAKTECGLHRLPIQKERNQEHV